jgi:hypothetical protein
MFAGLDKFFDEVVSPWLLQLLYGMLLASRVQVGVALTWVRQRFAMMTWCNLYRGVRDSHV